MKKLLLVLALVGFLAGNAWAIPSINGLVGAGEWDNSIVHVYDSKDLPVSYAADRWDIKELFMIQDTNGDLYFRMDLYGIPITQGYDGDGYYAVPYFMLDYDNNGVWEDQIRVNYDGSLKVMHFDSPNWWDAGTTATVVDVWEFRVPYDKLVSASLPLNKDFRGRLKFDNGGAPPEDYVPGEFETFTIVPEPMSMSLLGLGLLGALGAGFRRKK